MVRIGLTGYLGYETAERLFREHRQDLQNRFPGFFLRMFEKLGSLREGDGISDGLKEHAMVFPVLEGGLLGTVWSACESWSGKEPCGSSGEKLNGCRIFLEDIPIRQEVVEICERYGINPYECSSEGAFLLLWEEEELTIDERIMTDSLAVIGYLTQDKGRILVCRDRIRFLTPPKRQKKDLQSRKCAALTRE